ncbi:glycosyltransferase family 2 protein [Pedobacter sp. AW31-3R]|uniref:glycosyltransferase family 2 protein n=1 Tax=Pedobacter sp. AW31-3R TaxID=3445781 RepID=UPI003FA19529
MAVNIDIIILSYAKTEELKQLTLQGIESLFLSENPQDVHFEVLVIESDKSLAPYQYPRTTTIYPEETFGFNKYMNIGISRTANTYVCLCNNDLLYHKNWATTILAAMAADPAIKSANPYCENFEYHSSIENGGDVVFRHKTRKVHGALTGWCLFVKRTVFNTIGPLDEQFDFWYADNDYDYTLWKYKLAHALIRNSRVTHLVSKSHDTLDHKREEMTTGQKEKFDQKWVNISLIKKIVFRLHDKLMPYKR